MSKRKPLSGRGGAKFAGPGQEARPGRRAAPRRPGADGRESPRNADSLWLFGTHAVAAALDNPRRKLLRLLAAGEAAAHLEARLGALTLDGAPRLERVERGAIERLLPPGAVHQGVALLARPLPAVDIDEVTRPAGSPLIVLDRVSDPRNVGAVMRSAAALGGAAVIVPKRHAPEESGTLAKAASGALERVPLVRATNLARTLGALKEAGYWCIGLDAGAGKTLAETDAGGNIALVLGSEGEGLRRLTRETCDTLARLPMTETAGSLNLSVAAAIALYELARRPH